MAKPKEPEGQYFSLDPRQQRLFAATPHPPAVVPEPVPEEPPQPLTRRAPPVRTRTPVPVQSTIDDVIRRRTSA
ncbi:Hypothetical protein A7982_04442 [Minicystis rosea]|nr:Hypothetical protein A7982_04442 [Minicystis rosea]